MASRDSTSSGVINGFREILGDISAETSQPLLTLILCVSHGCVSRRPRPRTVILDGLYAK